MNTGSRIKNILIFCSLRFVTYLFIFNFDRIFEIIKKSPHEIPFPHSDIYDSLSTNLIMNCQHDINKSEAPSYHFLVYSCNASILCLLVTHLGLPLTNLQQSISSNKTIPFLKLQFFFCISQVITITNLLNQSC